MKKLMLTIAGLLFVSVVAVNAQVAQDTTSTSTGASGSSTMGTDQSSTMGTDQSSNYTRDMEVVQPTDVPSSLRSTLQGSEYSGWEEGKVYRNTTTNEYLIVIGDEDAKVYRFDSNGSKIEDLNNSTEGTSPGSSSSDMGTGSGTTGSGSTGTTDSGSTGTTDSGSTGTTGSSTDSGSTSGGSTSGSSSTGTTGSGSSTSGSSTGTTTDK